MNLAREMKEAASAKEIVIEEKIHITETEEIVEEIPVTVQEISKLSKVEKDGKDFIQFIDVQHLPSLSCETSFSLSVWFLLYRVSLTLQPPNVQKISRTLFCVKPKL